ncbi:MCE family protein [Streptomyces yaizuensis]|uniref:MCE family protein n=1 Tax=Streptomyces yaizuensis TaxID=2989713 RepID=A0ABQ5P754_9ACTN|nr:MCE family protein [Streptomyces sp. YSPA8]GLF98384.1 MCE family protein [Streptomyces sp. YSPA8]
MTRDTTQNPDGTEPEDARPTGKPKRKTSWKPPAWLRRPLRERNPVAVGLTGLLLLALLATGAYNVDALGGGTTYTADFTEAAGLTEGDEVRVAGVKVGQVTAVGLHQGRVRVRFRTEDAWIGDASTAAIAIKTLLGEKYLAVDPLGTRAQDPGRPIPTSRTTSPYDVTQAFTGLGETLGEIDTDQLAESFRAISDTFEDSAPDVRTAAGGLAALSRTVAERDAQLAGLLTQSRRITRTLATKEDSVETLLKDGSLLLGELQARRDAIHRLLTGTRDLGVQLSGVVRDNRDELEPALTSLRKVTAVLVRNRESLEEALRLAGPYYRLLNNAVGNGRWFDVYVCGLIPPDYYLPPGTPPPTSCKPPRSAPRGDGR